MDMFNNPILNQKFIIVDDFYKDPDHVRNLALSQSKEGQTQGNYAGVMTDNMFFQEQHHQMFRDLCGMPVKSSTQFNGKFRFTKEGEIGTQDIHFDSGDGSCFFAGVVYLTPNNDGTEGTIFWKHKRTGLENIPMTLEGIQQYGWNGVDDLKVFLDTDGVDHSKWDRIFTVPYRYNRLVLFRPWKFHSPGAGFGNTIETSRLVQLFFFSPDIK